MRTSPGAVVTTDGLAPFAGIADEGAARMPFSVGGRGPIGSPYLNRATKIPVKCKADLSRAYNPFGFQKHGAWHPKASALRFSNQVDLVELVLSILVSAAGTPSAQQQVIVKTGVVAFAMQLRAGVEKLNSSVRKT